MIGPGKDKAIKIKTPKVLNYYEHNKVLRDIPKIKGLSFIRMTWIINWLFTELHFHYYREINQSENPNLYKHMNRDLLKKVIGNKGLEVLRWLISNNLILHNTDYRVGQYSQSYKINKDLISDRGLIMIGGNPLLDKCYKLIWEKEKDKLDFKTLWVIEKTRELFHEVHFTMIESLAEKELIKIRKENENSYKLQTVLYDRFMSGEVNIVSDKRGNRIYGNWSNIKNDIYKHILIDGKYTMEIDISNSQLQLLLRLPRFRNKDWGFFGELIKAGKIYDFLVVKLNKSRRDIKKMVLEWLYCEYNIFINLRIGKYMKLYFPEAYNIILQYKINNKISGGMLLAHELQGLESDICIKTIQYDLMRDGHMVITKHDGFMISHDNDKAFQQICFKLNDLGLKYKIKINLPPIEKLLNLVVSGSEMLLFDETKDQQRAATIEYKEEKKKEKVGWWKEKINRKENIYMQPKNKNEVEKEDILNRKKTDVDKILEDYWLENQKMIKKH